MSDRVYARGFPITFTNEDLKSKFKVFGRIRKCQIFSGESKLYGIVRYCRPENVLKAIDYLNNQLIDGINWYVAICEKKDIHDSFTKIQKRRKNNYKKTLFVQDFPSECDKEKLKELFDKFGSIESIKLNQNTAYVTFVEISSATTAFEQRNLFSFNGNKVYVNKLKKINYITNCIRVKKYTKIEKKLQEKREKLERKMFAKYEIDNQ